MHSNIEYNTTQQNTVSCQAGREVGAAAARVAGWLARLMLGPLYPTTWWKRDRFVIIKHKVSSGRMMRTGVDVVRAVHSPESLSFPLSFFACTGPGVA